MTIKEQVRELDKRSKKMTTYERVHQKEEKGLEIYHSRNFKPRKWMREMSNEGVARYLRVLASGEHQIMCPTMVENIIERFK